MKCSSAVPTDQNELSLSLVREYLDQIQTEKLHDSVEQLSAIASQ